MGLSQPGSNPSCTLRVIPGANASTFHSGLCLGPSTHTMRTLRLLTAVALVATALTAFAARENPVIGLSLDTLKEERWQRDCDLFVAEAEKLGAKVIVQSANSDNTRQVRDIESLISRNVDVLVVVPHNGAAMSRAMKSAKEAGVPVIAYDRLILNSDIALYITFDNVRVGEL